MNKRNRIMSGAITGVLLVSLMGSPAIAFADKNDNNTNHDEYKKGYSNQIYNKNYSPRVYDHKKDKFVFIDGKHIKFNRKKVNFDVQPVIKEGRTLIPIRALEAMGAVVDWNQTEKIITVTKDDIRIFMNLVTDKVYVTESKTSFNELVAADEVVIDVCPGLINNRTFVPLRFIAETFGLKVDYNQGEISVIDQPRVIPTSVLYLTKAAIPNEAAVKVLDKDYTFDKIEGLALGTDYRYNSDTDFVYISNNYLTSLTNESNTLVFVFTKEGEKTVDVDYNVTLHYNATVTTLPALDKSVITYNDVDAINITMDLNEYALKGVTLDDIAFTTYTELDEVVTFEKAYLDTLTENTTFFFVFEKDGKADVKVKLKINVVPETVVLPTLNASVFVYNDLTDALITMALNDYTFKGVTVDDEAFTNLTKVGNIFILDNLYLDTLSTDTTFNFIFSHDGLDDVTIPFEVQVQ